MGPTAPKKKQPPVYTNDSVIESLRDLGANVSKSTTGAVGKIGADALAALFGSLPPKGELKPNQTVEIGREQPPAPVQRPELQPRPMARLSEDDYKLRQQLEAVRAELKALAASLKNLHQEVQTAIEQAPVAPGIYHVNFFEQLKSMLKVLRQQIEDSRTWLALWTTRKKKMGYWGLFKKHGTQFGLSGERAIATQAG